MKFEKKVELEIIVKDYRVKEDYHSFIIGFDRNISADKNRIIDSLEYTIFDVQDKSWFRDYPMIPGTEEDIYIFDECDYVLLRTLFEDDEKFKYTLSRVLELKKEINSL